MIRFHARSQSCEDRLLASPRLPDRASVRMKQLGSIQWTDFHEIWYVSFQKICRENSSFMKLGQE